VELGSDGASHKEKDIAGQCIDRSSKKYSTREE